MMLACRAISCSVSSGCAATPAVGAQGDEPLFDQLALSAHVPSVAGAPEGIDALLDGPDEIGQVADIVFVVKLLMS